MEKQNYKNAGVDVAAGEALVEKIKQKVRSTYGPRVKEGVGGFASLYQLSDDKLLACGTDGVGTKLKLAQSLNIHHTVGIDLVAMCVNDILCTGATPLFFLDYLACGKLDVLRDEAIIDGVVEGCQQSGMALIGGETAEMPGCYPEGEYDLAGFAVGEVHPGRVLDGGGICEGDSIIGIASSGFHSNGFSLLRQLVNSDEKALMEELLTPTRIYTTLLRQLQVKRPTNVKGVAHITGGGIHNIGRLNQNFNYQLDNMPALNELPEIFGIISERSGLSRDELYSTFNMGVGLVIITDTPQVVAQVAQKQQLPCWEIGRVVAGEGKEILS